MEIVESVGVAGKTDFNRVKKYFRLEVRKDVTAKGLFGCNPRIVFYCHDNYFCGLIQNMEKDEHTLRLGHLNQPENLNYVF